MSNPDILAVPMDPERNDAKAGTIRGYLCELLDVLWSEQEGFSGKRPFGNSGWEYDLYRALIEAGHIKGLIDDEGDIISCDTKRANRLISEAIDTLRKP